MRNLALVLLASSFLALLASPCSGSDQIGSFEDGERPMYIEVDQLVADLPYQFEIRNFPAGSLPLYLMYSTAVSPLDLRARSFSLHGC